jgi:hypothetical protein
MTARSMRVGFGFGPKTLRVTRTLVNALGVPVVLRVSSSSAKTLAVTRALVPVVGENITLTYSGAGGPSAAQALTLTNQTGPSHTSSSTQQLSWTAATAGGFPISYYRVYRNGSQINSNGATTGTTYSDTTATNSNVLSLQGPATAYYYQVSAVDTQGTEGSLTTDFVCYMYQGTNGGSTCSSVDFSAGMVSENWSDTAGSPVGGGIDIGLVYGGIFQPYSEVPLCETYGLELGGFTSGGSPAGTSGYGHFDIKPINSGNTFFYGLISRAPPFGDIFNYIGPGNITPYVTGPTPGVLTLNVWNSVKIPLNVNSIGTTTFTASVGAPYGSDANGAYATMTVTGTPTGVGVDYGGFVTSPAAVAGARIGLQGESGNPGGVWHIQGAGVTGSTVVTSQTFTCQRTNMYKLALGLNSGAGTPGTVYVNNIRFTRLGTL